MKAFFSITVILALAISAILLQRIDTGRTDNQLGKFIAYTDRFPFHKDKDKRRLHADIIRDGLSDVRGLAIDEKGDSVFIEEANRPLEVYAANPSTKALELGRRS